MSSCRPFEHPFVTKLCLGLAVTFTMGVRPCPSQTTENPGSELQSKPAAGSQIPVKVEPVSSLAPQGRPVSVQSVPLRLVQLRQAIERGRAALNASRLPKPAEAKQRLVNQMQAFEAYLGGAKSPNAQAWFKFLKWNELLVELASSDPSLRSLTDVELRYYQNILGLEYAPFQQMRRAIADYIDAERFGANPEGTIKLLDAQLERIGKQTEDVAVSELERMRDLGQVIGYLHSARQAPELVSAVRAAYSQPNVRLSVGEPLVNRAIGRPVAQPSPVDECILGTRVLGNSFVSGQVFADLVPQYNGVALQVTLNANFSSNNIGYNRGVKVYTTGASPVYASKRITITPEGMYSSPAVASTNLQSQIHGIEHRLKLVRKIATRKAAQQKPQADAIGQYRLQTRLGNQFNQQIEQQLAQSNSQGNPLSVLTEQQNRVEFQRLGVAKPTWSLQSSDFHVLADFKEADVVQLAAPTPSPLAKSADDIVAEVHQSLPINLAESFLGGRTLHSWEMDDLVRQFTSKVPEELIKESEGEPWSLTFADRHPVEVEFADGLAIVTLRIVKMANADQELNQPATVTAQYRPVLGGGWVVLERVGEVEMKFVRAPSGIRAVTLRSFFKGKFDKLFRERTEPQKATFTTRMPNLSQLTLSNVTFNQGWAQVTVR